MTLNPDASSTPISYTFNKMFENIWMENHPEFQHLVRDLDRCQWYGGGRFVDFDTGRLKKYVELSEQAKFLMCVAVFPEIQWKLPMLDKTAASFLVNLQKHTDVHLITSRLIYLSALNVQPFPKIRLDETRLNLSSWDELVAYFKQWDTNQTLSSRIDCTDLFMPGT